MSVTIFGVIADKYGHCHWKQYGPEILGGYIDPRCDDVFAAYPAAAYATVQPAYLPVEFDHDGHRRGEVHYLERSHDQLYAVAVIDDPYLPEDFADTRHYWSSTTNQPPGAPLKMTELSITERPASVGLPPLRYLPGDIRRGGPRTWSRDHTNEIIRRAITAVQRHECRSRLTVATPDTPRNVGSGPTSMYRAGPRSAGRVVRLPDGSIVPLEIKPGGRILSVR